MIHKKILRIIVICMAFLLTLQYSIIKSNNTVMAEVKKDGYIVITDDVDTIENIRDKYTVNSITGEALTVELSDADVMQLESDNDITCIEKDFMINSQVEAGWDIVKPKLDNWNLEAIGVENNPSSPKIKVALLDSGIDITDNIDVKERRNFIAESPVTTPLYEDLCGHGTSVASLLVGKGIDSNVIGVKQNIELYSARVLDEHNQAPISRVVEAIYWAIEKDVDIINISFGTQSYSEALKVAVEEANEAGILVIAAAGNYGDTRVDYPAAFENVLSVGAINAYGEVSDFSSKGKKVDIYAPGEAILTQGNFGIDLIMSGTSLSTPQVTGVAALLLSKDLSKPPAFIKSLIKLSAKSITNNESAYGLIDYNYALKLYDTVESQYDSITKDDSLSNLEMISGNENKENKGGGPKTNVELVDVGTQEFEHFMMENLDVQENNEKIIDMSSDVVEGSWTSEVHTNFTENQYLKWGAEYTDKHKPPNGDKTKPHTSGIGAHPELHGFAWHNDNGGGLASGDCNYMSNYKYLVKVAAAYGKNQGYTSVLQSEVNGLNSTCFSDLKKDLQFVLDHDQRSVTCDEFCGTKKMIWGQTDINQRAFVLGMAMHTATDVYAHSAFYKYGSSVITWDRITHTNGHADDITFCPGRYNMAKAVIKNVISRLNNERTTYDTCNDFYNTATGAYSNLNYRITKMRTFAEAAGYTNSSVLNDFGKLQSQ